MTLKYANSMSNHKKWFLSHHESEIQEFDEEFARKYPVKDLRPTLFPNES